MRFNMDDEIYEKYMQAGKIAAEAREYGAKLIKPGVRFLNVTNKIESKIQKNGAGLAFPVNISINKIAAHYSPRHDDTSVFMEGDVVKLDVGAHIDGYIADTAITIEVGTNNHEAIINASKDALNNAIKLMKANIDLSQIGKVIEDTITSFGYKPIDNLTGHGLKRYELHSGMSIPNVSNSLSKIKPKAGDVVAIEPFATNGAGHVVSGKGSNIYICTAPLRSKFIRDPKSRFLLKRLNDKFKTLPFAERWCVNTIPNVDVSLRKLSFLGVVNQFPQLIEKDNGIVTQTEHTVIVTKDGCEVTTS